MSEELPYIRSIELQVEDRLTMIKFKRLMM